MLASWGHSVTSELSEHRERNTLFHQLASSEGNSGYFYSEHRARTVSSEVCFLRNLFRGFRHQKLHSCVCKQQTRSGLYTVARGLLRGKQNQTMQRKSASNGEQQSLSLHEEDVEIKASLSELTAAVQAVQEASSWWDLYGVDWCYIASGFALIPPGLLLLRYQTWPPFIAGLILLGFYYGMLKTKMSHLASHSALCRSKLANRFWQFFFIEFCGSFSAEYAIGAHIKIHHPYTNVIGLGDSSTWKVPILPRYIYLFVAPLFLPVMTPIAAVLFLLKDKKVLKAFQCFIVVSTGLVANISLLAFVSGLTTKVAVLSTLVYRAVMEIPYIHVNIFQHIGLPMYARDGRPPRLHLMSHGVLNLSHNLLLDWNFGHSLIACHIEHHLFPKLSDNMCLKVQPIVQQYLQDHGLPYQKRGYMNRLKFFAKEYKMLMVDAPPITQFIGVQ